MWKEHYLMSLDTPLLKLEMVPSNGKNIRNLQ